MLQVIELHSSSPLFHPRRLSTIKQLLSWAAWYLDSLLTILKFPGKNLELSKKALFSRPLGEVAVDMIQLLTCRCLWRNGPTNRNILVKWATHLPASGKGSTWDIKRVSGVCEFTYSIKQSYWHFHQIPVPEISPVERCIMFRFCFCNLSQCLPPVILTHSAGHGERNITSVFTLTPLVAFVCSGKNNGAVNKPQVPSDIWRKSPFPSHCLLCVSFSKSISFHCFLRVCSVDCPFIEM